MRILIFGRGAIFWEDEDEEKERDPINVHLTRRDTRLYIGIYSTYGTATVCL